MDAGGWNTTAAAAVLIAAKHLTLAETTALVLGGTGPVGQRVAPAVGRRGGDGPRRLARFAAGRGRLQSLADRFRGGRLSAWSTSDDDDCAPRSPACNWSSPPEPPGVRS